MEAEDLLTPPTTVEEQPRPVFEIDEPDARVLLEQSGWTLTPAHDRAKCEEELNLFLRLEADLMSPHGPLAQKMQEDVLSALRAGGTIKIRGEDVPQQVTEEGPQEKKDETQMMTLTKPKRGGGRPKGSKNKAPKKGPGRPKKAESSTRGMTILDAAHKVLSGSKKPLNRQELFERIQARGLWESPSGKTPADTLSAAIYVEIRKKGKESRFVLADRGLFTAKK